MYEMSAVSPSIPKTKWNLLKRHKVHLRHFIDYVKVQFYDVPKSNLFGNMLAIIQNTRNHAADQKMSLVA
jgi:hypothetical protein